MVDPHGTKHLLTKLGNLSEEKRQKAQQLAREFADKTARNRKKQNANQNVDDDNLALVKAEIENLEKSLDPKRDPKQQHKIKSRLGQLRAKLKTLEQSQDGGLE